MRKKAIYVSLDERNCNYGFPYQLGKMAGLDIIRPPESIMSKIKKPCDNDQMWEWLLQNVKGCSYALLSLDMLVYGSLMNSRHHNMTEEECLKRLDRIKELKAINPELEIHGFTLIMRTANCDNSSEEPEYWAEYGKRIWKYSWLSDKKMRAGLSPEEEIKLRELIKAIPESFLADYTGRRKKNLNTNLKVLDLVKENVIDYLIIPKDDNSEFGFSNQDQEMIYARILENGIRGRVNIYPGTDEVGCTLVSRVINKTNGYMPKIYVYYSSTLGGDIVAKYEDRPINESVKWQIVSSGALMVDNYEKADIVLMVNTPGKYMIECSEQAKKDYSYNNFRNLEEFVQKLKYFISEGKRCIVADIAYSNGADNELMEILKTGQLFDKIFAYGGWNTAANTIGVVILQGLAALATGAKSIREIPGLFEFHIGKIIEDWAYQANVMLSIGGEYSGNPGFDSYKLGGFKDQIRKEIIKQVNEFVDNNLTGCIPVRSISVRDVKLAWERTFDVEFSLDASY